MSQNVEQQQAAAAVAAANRNQKSQPQQQQPQREKAPVIEDQGPPSRPAALAHRLIVVPDPPQHANRPLPPTPPPQSQAAPAPQPPLRNNPKPTKPIVSSFFSFKFICTLIHT